MQPILDVRCQLGEGLLWHEGTLHWLDIVQQIAHRYTPADGRHQATPLDEMVTAIAPHVKGGFIATGRKHVGYWDGESATLEPYKSVETDQPEARFNDAAVDPYGNFWAGTMNPPHTTSGLYVLTPHLGLTRMQGEIGLANGIGWSPDRSTMYFTDSLQRTIYTFDYAVGTIRNKQAWVTTEEGIDPDGLTVDSEGYVWSAHYDGGRVVRYTPDGGIDRVIEVPTPLVTNVTFGGPGLDELYITTAYRDDSRRASDRLAGAVFHLPIGIKGQPTGIFGGVALG